MPTAITAEDGTGIATANSYVTEAEADTYLDNRLNSAGWGLASADDKLRSLLMSTVQLDALYQWNGYRTNPGQALQWPRYDVNDPDSGNGVFPRISFRQGDWLDENTIHPFLKQAQIELALALLGPAGVGVDRMKDPDGEGIAEFELSGVLSVVFDQKTKKPPFPQHVTDWLVKYGRPLFGPGGSVKMMRA
jgi:hypothetical protein